MTDLINQSVTELFVEQPLASPWSAKHLSNATLESIFVDCAISVPMQGNLWQFLSEDEQKAKGVSAYPYIPQ